MGIEYIGLPAVGWHVMTESWHNIVCCLLCCSYYRCHVGGIHADFLIDSCLLCFVWAAFGSHISHICYYHQDSSETEKGASKSAHSA